MAKSSQRLSINGSKLYALYQVAHFIAPATANEIATHINRVLRNGLNPSQVAMHLRKRSDCLIRIHREPGSSKTNIYTLLAPENADISKSRRRVDLYLCDLLHLEAEA